MIKAILFDFDGTIVDSLPHIHAAWKYAFEQQGHSLSDKEIIEKIFYSTKEEKIANYGVDADKLSDDFHIVIYKRQENYVLNPFIEDVLKELSQRSIKTAIVTLASSERVKGILDNFCIGYLFTAVLGGKDAGRPKPHPDIALKAMELLQVTPEETLLVGDSAMDIETGKNAGVQTGLYMPENNTQYIDRELIETAQPNFTFTNFSELLSKI